MCRAKLLFQLIRERLNIPHGEDHLELDLAVPVTVAELPSMGEIVPYEEAPQDAKNNNNAAGMLKKVMLENPLQLFRGQALKV